MDYYHELPPNPPPNREFAAIGPSLKAWDSSWESAPTRGFAGP